jgi:hypothetical protein
MDFAGDLRSKSIAPTRDKLARRAKSATGMTAPETAHRLLSK